MLATLIKKELLNNLLNARFVICYCITFVLILLSVINQGVRYDRDLTAFRLNSTEFKKEMQEAETLDGSSHYSLQIPPARLGVFSNGFDRHMSTPYRVEMARPDVFGQYNNADPVRIQYKMYDLGFVIAFVMSLVAVFMSFDVINGESAEGTMRLMQANPVSKSVIILGKLLGGYLTLILPFVFSWLIALVLLPIFSGITLAGYDWIRTGLMMTHAGVYIGVFYLLGTFYSALFASRVHSLLALVVSWMVLVALVPNISFALSKILIDIPQESELIREKEAVRTALADEARENEERLTRTTPKDQLPPEVSAALIKKWVDAWYNTSLTWTRMLHDQRVRLENRMRLGMTLARISPASCFLFGFSHLAGTGAGQFRNTEEWKYNVLMKTNEVCIAEEQRRRAIITETEHHKLMSALYAMGPLDPALLPDLTYRPVDIRRSTGWALQEALILLLELVVLFMATYAAFIRKKTV